MEIVGAATLRFSSEFRIIIITAPIIIEIREAKSIITILCYCIYSSSGRFHSVKPFLAVLIPIILPLFLTRRLFLSIYWRLYAFQGQAWRILSMGRG